MKKYLLVVAVSIALPLAAFAAYNDVILTTDTVISVGGIDLNVSGGNSVIESIAVASSNFSAVLQPGSTLSISSSNGKVITSDAPSINVSGSECTAGGKSILTLSQKSDASGSVTVKVTPSSSTCVGNAGTATGTNAGSNGGPGGGGGGGGGGGSTYIAPISTAAPTVPVVNTTQTVNPTGSNTSTVSMPVYVFTKPVSVGVTSTDVQKLQQFLNADPDTRIAASGVGSPGHETKYFGPATKKAIQKFQVKWGIAKPGDVGYGTLGPKTRAKLNSLSGTGTTAPASTTVTPSAPAAQTGNSTADIAKQLNDSLKLLQALQAQLKALKP